ncbi:MAG TPA: BTAD domain-containing putative transcriptional regulator [Gemmatimonadales bacterium]
MGDEKDFEQWSERERARHAERYIEALERLAESAHAQGDSAGAVRWWRQVVVADPLRAQGALGLMRALAAAGDSAGAVQHARIYDRLLRDELELPPDRAVTQLSEVLQATRTSSTPGHGPSVTASEIPLTSENREEGHAGSGSRHPGDLKPVQQASNSLIRKLLAVGGVGLVGVLLLAAGVLIRSRDRGRALLEPGWVLIADFEGPAEDPTLTRAVRELVRSALIESGVVQTVPSDLVQEARRQAQVPDTARMTADIARHIAFRTAVEMVVDGSVMPVGQNGYGIALRLVGVSDGRVLASASGAATEQTIIAESGKLARRVITGVHPAPVGGRTVPPVEVMTPSFEAYRRFVEGEEPFQAGNYTRALGFYRDALERDPDFAHAWLQIGLAFQGLNMPDSSDRALRQAALGIARLPPAARIMLAGKLTNRHADRVRALEQIIRLWPMAPDAYQERAEELQFLARYDEALVSLERAYATWPLGRPPRTVIEYAGFLAALGRYEEAEGVGKELTGYFRESLIAHIELVSGNWAKAESLAVAILQDPSLPPVRRFRMNLIIGSACATRGQLQKADRLFAEAERAALREGIFGPGSSHWGIGYQRLVQALAGGRKPIGPVVEVRRDTSTAATIMEAIWAAFAGDLELASRSREVVAALGIDDGYGLWRDLLGLEASLYAVRGDWDSVTRTLAQVAYEGGGQIEGGVVFRRWLVADAYERLGNADSAAAFLEMIVTLQRTSWWESFAKGPVYSFAHRRLALLYAKLGKPELARRHWARFIAMFTDPDPDLIWMREEARGALEQ